MVELGAFGPERRRTGPGADRPGAPQRHAGCSAVEETTYEEVRSALRRGLALQSVQGSGHVPFPDRFAVGYEGSTSFNHAFRRWTELAAKDLREDYRFSWAARPDGSDHPTIDAIRPSTRLAHWDRPGGARSAYLISRSPMTTPAGGEFETGDRRSGAAGDERGRTSNSWRDQPARCSVYPRALILAQFLFASLPPTPAFDQN